MDPKITAVTLHRIVSDGVSILPVEAVALVRQLWRMIDSDRRHGTQGRIPALDQVRLRSTGELRVSDDHSSGPEVQTVEFITALGTMLAALLSAGREWDTNPAQLRRIVRRAMIPADRVTAFDPNATPFASTGDFLRALDDFAPATRTTDLRPLFERWHTTTAAQGTSLVGTAAAPPLLRSVSMSTAVPLSTAAESEASDDPQATTDQPEATLDASQENINTHHQDLYDPDGRLDDFACEASLAVEDSDRGSSSPLFQANKETNRLLNGTSVSDLEAEIERLVKSV